MNLKVPKLRSLPFETAIIERYRRRKSTVEEALVEVYLARVSVRRVEGSKGRRHHPGAVGQCTPSRILGDHAEDEFS